MIAPSECTMPRSTANVLIDLEWYPLFQLKTEHIRNVHGQAFVFKLALLIMNIKHTGIALAIVALLAFSSCVGIDAEARINAEGSVELTLRYEVSLAMDRIGRLGANEKYLPLPIGQDDLLLAVSRVGGELLSWSRDDGSDRFIVNTRIRFPTTNAFASFLDPSGRAVSFTETSATRSLSIQLGDGRVPAEPELTRFVQAAFSDYRTSIIFTLPRVPSIATNLVVEGLRARFSMPSPELFSSLTPVILVLEW